MKLLRSTLLLLFVYAGTAYGQPESFAERCTPNESWVSLGNGVDGPVAAATSYNGDFYVVYNDTPPGVLYERYRLAKWDGRNWLELEVLDVEGEVRTMMWYEDALYVGGEFLRVNDLPNTGGIVRWDGAQLTAVGGGVGQGATGQVISTMVVYKGELYVGGEFEAIDGKDANSIARWDGVSWKDIDKGVAYQNSIGTATVSTLYVADDKLFVGGTFGRVGSIPSNSIAVWDGSAWSAQGLDNFIFTTVRAIAEYDKEIYAYGPGIGGRQGVPGGQHVVRWDGTRWSSPVAVGDLPGGSFAVYEGELYSAGSVDQWADSILRTSFGIAKWDGTEWKAVSAVNAGDKLYLHDDQLIVAGEHTESCGSPLNHVSYMCTDENCARISGTVFYDGDGNCTQGNGEEGLQGRIIEITPGPFYVNTNADGYYSQIVATGAYSVTVAPHLYWNADCPTLPIAVELKNAGDHSKGNDVAATPVPGITDIRVSVASGPARPGAGQRHTLKYSNVGTETVNGTVQYDVSPTLEINDTDPPYDRKAGNLLEWDFTDLRMEESRRIVVETTVSRESERGTVLCSHMAADPAGDNDNMDHDNRDSSCVEVRGSYDPNDIQVFPIDMEGDSWLEPTDTTLTYLVRFQNTGTDTAFRVIVVDTLSTGLFDMTTVRPGAASHEYTFEMSGAGELRWTFNTILLPDSNVNEMASHGYLKYTVRVKKGLAPLTTIPNRADIYFDFNDPVMTNTVISVIANASSVPVEPNEIAVRLYPNPATSVLHIQGGWGGEAIVTLRNILGETVRRYEHVLGNTIEIDIVDLEAGTYLVRIETEEGMATGRVTIVK